VSVRVPDPTKERLKRLARGLCVTPLERADIESTGRADRLRWWLTGCVEGDVALPVREARNKLQALDEVEKWLASVDRKLKSGNGIS
jgi:predicted transcriptional regulator